MILQKAHLDREVTRLRQQLNEMESVFFCLLIFYFLLREALNVSLRKGQRESESPKGRNRETKSRSRIQAVCYRGLIHFSRHKNSPVCQFSSFQNLDQSVCRKSLPEIKFYRFCNRSQISFEKNSLFIPANGALWSIFFLQLGRAVERDSLNAFAKEKADLFERLNENILVRSLLFVLLESGN